MPMAPQGHPDHPGLEREPGNEPERIRGGAPGDNRGGLDTEDPGRERHHGHARHQQGQCADGHSSPGQPRQPQSGRVPDCRQLTPWTPPRPAASRRARAQLSLLRRGCRAPKKIHKERVSAAEASGRVRELADRIERLGGKRKVPDDFGSHHGCLCPAPPKGTSQCGQWPSLVR